jgi:hypothetical protein
MKAYFLKKTPGASGMHTFWANLILSMNLEENDEKNQSVWYWIS